MNDYFNIKYYFGYECTIKNNFKILIHWELRINVTTLYTFKDQSEYYLIYFYWVKLNKEITKIYILTHISQNILFDWLKLICFTKLWRPIYIFGMTHVNFNQSKRVCPKMCVVNLFLFVKFCLFNYPFFLSYFDKKKKVCC